MAGGRKVDLLLKPGDSEVKPPELDQVG